MAVLTASQARREARWTFKEFTLASGNKCFQGGAIFLNPATSKVVSGSNVAAGGLIFLGHAVDNVDATSADATVNVYLIEEMALLWWDNGTTTDACAATDVGSYAYALDDHTVSILASGKSPIGIIRAVDSNGVAVEKIRATGGGLASNPVAPAYVTNDSILTSVQSGGLYDVPTTAGASTITLPATTPDGTIATFVADGTKNGHAVTYRDATGPVNLTTGLTASKRHEVIVAKLGGKWFANAYVSP